MRPAPDASVVNWIDAQVIETLYLSAITVADLRFGVGVLPDGRRKEQLLGRLEGEVLPLFSGRVLDFDLAASAAYAGLMAHARAKGEAIGKSDGFIAARAAVHGLAVATRDAALFHAAGVEVINPWAKTS